MHIVSRDAMMRQRNEPHGLQTCDKETVIAHACLHIPYRDFIVSLAFDDSCGTMDVLGRVDLRVYRADNEGFRAEDVTEHIKYKKDNAIHPYELTDLLWVRRRIDRAIRLGLI